MHDGSVQTPETRYARNGDVHIAYQVLGDGPVDLVFFGGTVSHCELLWDEPTAARFLRRLASFSRLVMFDKRGVGMSDPAGSYPTLEERLSDVKAVLDEIGCDDVILFGNSEGGPLAVMFAVAEPTRTHGLVLMSTYARLRRADDYPDGISDDEFERRLRGLERYWGQPQMLRDVLPSLAGDDSRLRWWAQFFRRATSPGALAAQLRMNFHTDVSALLGLIQAPTLILHGRDEPFVDVHHSRWMAERIPEATLIELDGGDHMPFADLSEPVADEVEEFVTGARAPAEPDRKLATVLFSDVVDSTSTAADAGDRRWRARLDRHDWLVRRELERFRGIEVKHTGDGFLAVFDGPVQAIRCGHAMCDSLVRESLPVRVGVHTGEVEVRGDDIGGIAVHIGARVMAAAGPSEVLVSQAIPPLVVGSGLAFEDRGVHELKGVPGPWRLFAVTGNGGPGTGPV